MITLFFVTLMTCANQQCHAEVLADEVYTKRDDCEDRARHLTDINPGREFVCGTVKRKAS
jgi:hypothetical protein